MIYKLNIQFTSNNMYIMQINKSCEVRIKVADIMYTYDLLNDHIFPHIYLL
jgi:hypothetical protein